MQSERVRCDDSIMAASMRDPRAATAYGIHRQLHIRLFHKYSSSSAPPDCADTRSQQKKLDNPCAASATVKLAHHLGGSDVRASCTKTRRRAPLTVFAFWVQLMGVLRAHHSSDEVKVGAHRCEVTDRYALQHGQHDPSQGKQ